MADKIATREAYGKALVALADKYPFVVLDADLSQATKTCLFAKEHPDRFFDCGIAEGNMMSVAAGIASTGTIPFVSSFAMFAAGRAFEQVRNSVAYPHLNVKIGATHAGITVGEDGATHQCCEDFALMRVIPGMTVICPADGPETYAAVEAALKWDGPVYLRFGRYAVPEVTAGDAVAPFEIGRGRLLREGTDVSVVAVGYMVHLALEAADLLAAEGISAEVIDMHTLKPLDAKLLLSSAGKTGAVVIAEEHNSAGGLGEAVAGLLVREAPAPAEFINGGDRFGQTGTPSALMKAYGLDAEHIAEAARKAVGRK